MKFEDHCIDCIHKLGKAFPKVHKWLDAFAKDEGWSHRYNRHHDKGIEEVRKKWGDKAAKAAELHIRSDMMGHVPKKEEWYTSENWLEEFRSRDLNDKISDKTRISGRTVMR